MKTKYELDVKAFPIVDIFHRFKANLKEENREFDVTKHARKKSDLD